VVVLPDCANVTVLLIGLYGMYQGIEVQHPLYAVLFLNLAVSWISSLVNRFLTGSQFLQPNVFWGWGGESFRTLRSVYLYSDFVQYGLLEFVVRQK
jgi:hypothetical protein